MKLARFVVLLLIVFAPFYGQTQSPRITHYTEQKIKNDLLQRDFALGDPVYIRVFKKEAILELWMRPDANDRWQLFRSYSICKNSGHLGPKTRVGDRQAPEGFYQITPHSLNPNSNFHLSINIGYPNRYDRYYGRTGSLLMIHGDCVSVGCYAMGDSQIEEIYYLIEHAFSNGQKSIDVAAFPYQLSDENIKQYQDNYWYPFWQELKLGYDYFNQSKQLPDITIKAGHYLITN